MITMAIDDWLFSSQVTWTRRSWRRAASQWRRSWRGFTSCCYGFKMNWITAKWTTRGWRTLLPRRPRLPN